MEPSALEVYTQECHDPGLMSNREGIMSTSSAKPKREVHYQDSDGKPMGETGIHVNATILELFGTLKGEIVLKDLPGVYVAADMFFYYEQGNPRAVKAPDIMVIKGVDDGTIERRTLQALGREPGSQRDHRDHLGRNQSRRRGHQACEL